LNRARPSQLSALAATFKPNIGFHNTHSGASGNKLDAINVKLKKALGQHIQAAAPVVLPQVLDRKPQSLLQTKWGGRRASF
jgi:hypothetical protein